MPDRSADQSRKKRLNMLHQQAGQSAAWWTKLLGVVEEMGREIDGLKTELAELKSPRDEGRANQPRVSVPAKAT